MCQPHAQENIFTNSHSHSYITSNRSDMPRKQRQSIHTRGYTRKIETLLYYLWATKIRLEARNTTQHQTAKTYQREHHKFIKRTTKLGS